MTPIVSRFDASTTALGAVDGLSLAGKRALVTGGASGIGLEIVRALVASGANVMIADIDRAASSFALKSLKDSYSGAEIEAVALDLGSLASVRVLAAELLRRSDPLHILINNAGIMACPMTLSADGHELQFAVNYLGHFLLANLLAPLLEREAPSRIVSVSSIGHRRSDIDYEDPDFERRPYDRWVAYGQSKTACALLATGLTGRYAARRVTCNAVNPGGSHTGLMRYLSDEEMRQQGWVNPDGSPPGRWRDPAVAAATSVWAATGPELDGVGGLYLENCRSADRWSPENPMTGVRDYAVSPVNAERLWAMSERMTGMRP